MSARQRLLDYIVDAFDPRMGNQPRASNVRKGEVADTAGTRVVVEDAPELDIPMLDLRDFEGQGIMTSMSDRTAGGGILSQIDDVRLNQPVALEGGQNFMFLNPGATWASDPRVVRQMQAEAQRLRGATGRDPLFAPFRMAPGGKDYSTMPGDAMLSFIDSSASKKVKNDLTQKIRQVVPEFKGFDGKWYEQYAQLTGNQRKDIKTILDANRGMTGIGAGKARVAVTDPRQLEGRDGTLLNIGRVDTARQPGSASHRTYRGELPGEGLGQFEKPDVLVTQLFPQTVSKTTGKTRKVKNPDNPTHSDIRAFQMRPVGGIIDEPMLRRVYGSMAGMGILGALGAPDQAQASPIPGGLTMPSMRDVRAGIDQGQDEQSMATNMVLEALMNFMAPTMMGDATMDAYNRGQIQ
jgi:hypothetical protein